MNQNRISLRLVAFSAATLACLLTLASHARAADDTAEALVYTTMPCTAQHNPVMAMDGDPNTYYRSVYGMDDGDTFLILLSQPVHIHSIKVTTGDADNQDILTQAVLETSVDGTTFKTAASFDAAGVAEMKSGDVTAKMVRIRLNARRGVPTLVIREITIDSDPKIVHVQRGPGRGFADISKAPDVAAWAAKAESQMEAFWPDTEALLYSDRFITPNMVNVVYRTGPGVTDVAATGGGVMTVNAAWCRSHPEDTGLTVHEMAHVVQSMSAYDPVWLIEGTADYIRWIKFEPENFPVRINPARATYHDAYRTTAIFLAWLELHYDSRLTTKLNEATRFGKFKLDMFKQYCGKDVDTLWSEFIADYKANPKTIITRKIAPEDMPRTLPTVTAGSSTPVDLSTLFDATGIVKDGATFGESGGVDAGGAAYSASLLTPTVTSKNVEFRLGPAGAKDILTAKGQVVTVPAGAYTSLWVLGAAIDGSQHGQVFLVTYTDGTTDTLTQNISDWFEPGRFPGETRAVRMPYRNLSTGDKDPRTFYAYSYGFPLAAGKTVKSVTLPTSENVKILGLTLAK